MQTGVFHVVDPGSRSETSMNKSFIAASNDNGSLDLHDHDDHYDHHDRDDNDVTMMIIITGISGMLNLRKLWRRNT